VDGARRVSIEFQSSNIRIQRLVLVFYAIGGEANTDSVRRLKGTEGEEGQA